jgi:hypothetical protein
MLARQGQGSLTSGSFCMFRRASPAADEVREPIVVCSSVKVGLRCGVAIAVEAGVLLWARVVRVAVRTRVLPMNLLVVMSAVRKSCAGYEQRCACVCT